MLLWRLSAKPLTCSRVEIPPKMLEKPRLLTPPFTPGVPAPPALFELEA